MYTYIWGMGGGIYTKQKNSKTPSSYHSSIFSTCKERLEGRGEKKDAAEVEKQFNPEGGHSTWSVGVEVSDRTADEIKVNNPFLTSTWHTRVAISSAMDPCENFRQQNVRFELDFF